MSNLQPRGGHGADPRYRARSPSFGSGDDRYFDGSGGVQQRNAEDFYNQGFYDRRNEGAASPPAASGYGAPPSNMALTQSSQYVPTPPAHSTTYQPMYYGQNSTTLPNQPNIPPPPPRQQYGTGALPGTLQAGQRPLPGPPGASTPKIGAYNPGNMGRTMSLMTATSPTSPYGQQYGPQSPTVSNAPSYPQAYANSQYNSSVGQTQMQYNPALYNSNVPPPPPPQRHATTAGYHQSQLPQPPPPPPPPPPQHQQTYPQYSNSTTPAYTQLAYSQAPSHSNSSTPAIGSSYSNGDARQWGYANENDQNEYGSSSGQRYGSTSSQTSQSPAATQDRYSSISSNYYDSHTTQSPRPQYANYNNDGGEYRNPLPTPPPPPPSHSPQVNSQQHYGNGQHGNQSPYDNESPPQLPPHTYSEAPDRQRLEEDAREALYADIENLVLGNAPDASDSQFKPDVDLLFPKDNSAPYPAAGNNNGALPYPTGQGLVGNSSDEAAAAWEAMRADEFRENQEKLTNGHIATLPPDSDQEPLAGVLDMPIDISGFSGFYGGGYDDDEPAPPMFKQAGQDTFAPVLPIHSTTSDPARNTPTSANTNQLSRNDTTSTAVTSATTTSNSETLYGDYVYPNPEEDVLHPFAPFSAAAAAAARVDTFGTGGLANPERRNSFAEGDEYEGFVSATRSKVDEEDSDDEMYAGFMEQPSFYPTPSYELNRTKSGSNATPETYLPASAESRLKSSLSLNYPHTSTSSLGPARSKTDASAPLKPTGARPPTLRPPANRASVAQSQIFDDGALGAIDLPSIKTRKFDPEKLSSKDFKKCSEPWAISQIYSWLKTTTEGEEFLKEKGIAEAIVALFTHKVPTMNVADAETLAARVLKTLWENKCLVSDEEWVKWTSDAEVSGVIFQVSGRGCYAPRLHSRDHEDLQHMPGRCYAHLCARTLKKISLGAHPEDKEKKKEDWATFWGLKLEDIEKQNRKEIERQNNLHEVVQTEQEYLEHMRVLRVVYLDQLIVFQKQRSIIKPKVFDQFVKDVFGKADAVRKANEDHLLPQLKFRQREQGPWIVGFSDIFREWIRRAKPAYIEYAAAFPMADAILRYESEKNILFRQFLDHCRQDPRASRLEWQHFLKNPITRLQRYGLLLTTILKHTLKEGDEKVALLAAIEEIKAVTLECDARVDETTKKVNLLELGRKLVMRSGMEVNLRLEEKGREVIYQGDLQRTGNRFTWLETHAILFDHYLVLAKTVQTKYDATGPGKSKYQKYDVSRMPIPMDLLVLEDSINDAPVVKSSVKIIGTATKQVQPSPGQRPSMTNSSSPAPLTHTQTSSSMGSVNSPGWDTSKDKDNIMYPFRIRHLGKGYKNEDNSYTLYAPSAAARADWVEKILLAKERHAASLFRQTAEPFRLRIMSDSAFGYEPLSNTGGPKDVNIRGTPLDRAIKEAESLYPGPKPPVLTRAQINCATTFQVGIGYSKQMVAIGTDAGVYISDYDNPRGWTKAINTVARVTQIAVLEDFSLFLVLADRTLIAYHLDVVVPPAGGAPVSETAKRAPQKLSGGKDVGFFATSRMKDRMLVFYKRKDGLHSTFKVLEPVFQKATERKSRFSRRGTTEFFREFDEFYIPAECYGISLFHSSLSIHSSKGFEVMTLDKKLPWSIPELKAPHVQAIAARLANQRPLGMFRLSDIEFLLCYEECGVYVNKHGDVSRSVIMEFVGKAKASAHYPPYVLLFDQDFVEIRDADNGRLRQVIAGRDARCLDDGQGGGSAGQRTIKLAMVHPESDTRQIVVELLLNDVQKE